jgi:hypothetical protein
MALKRICRCGKTIPYEVKYCESCSKKYDEYKRNRNKVYDRTKRNKESIAVYHSPVWIRLTEECKRRFKGLDIYSYYILGKVEYGSLSHHIEEVEENKERIYDIENLIYLTGRNHKMVHSTYNKDKESKRKMQELLFNLIKRYKEEFNI